MIPSHIEVLLASNSPRRHELLSRLGIVYRVVNHRADEQWPDDTPTEYIAEWIANAKSESLVDVLADNQLLITADTVVCLGDKVLGKPANEEEAVHMLRQLSDKTHTVYTGVCLRLDGKQYAFTEATQVTFYPLSEEAIHFYVKSAKPFDKAGAYGIQEWIGETHIMHIQGSYNNVVGLPTSRLFHELNTFLK